MPGKPSPRLLQQAVFQLNLKTRQVIIRLPRRCHKELCLYLLLSLTFPPFAITIIIMPAAQLKIQIIFIM